MISIKREWGMLAATLTLIVLASVTLAEPVLTPIYTIVLLICTLRIMWLVHEMKQVMHRMHEITALVADSYLDHAQSLDRASGVTSHVDLVRSIAARIRELGTATTVFTPMRRVL